mmetsp:Transcript_116601/g.308053  ORF Transcript_116601/g.308053 Transcript_116601/m.308053 type:complete len:277 (-) Transcript_116601:14-844(-)
MHLGAVAGEDGNTALELVRHVELVSIKEQDNHRGVIREPRNDLLEVVAALQPLPFSRQHPRGVDEGDALEHRVGHPCTLQSGQEAVPKGAQRREWEALVIHQGIARNDLRLLPVTDCHEPVGCWLGPDLRIRIQVTDQVLDEGRLPGGEGAHQQDHRPAGEVGGRDLWLVEVVELAGPLQRQQLLRVQLQQPFGDIPEAVSPGPLLRIVVALVSPALRRRQGEVASSPHRGVIRVVVPVLPPAPLLDLDAAVGDAAPHFQKCFHRQKKVSPVRKNT